MKAPEEWTEQDLLGMINEKREESVDLDFKSADALGEQDSKKKDISKDVSAFANSTGGVLIYGVAESDQEPHTADKLEPIDPADFSKEKLENVITSRIHPRISVRINPVELATQCPGKFVYVVAVPQSDTAHQASDKKYYKRFNFKSEPMEDYEVRQTMNRASRPAYEMKLGPVNITTQGDQRSFRFSGTLQNMSEIVGHDVSGVLFAPKDLVSQPDDYTLTYDGIEYARIPGEYAETSLTPRSVIHTVPPLTPFGLNFRKSLQFRVDMIPAKRFTVLVRVYDRFGLSLDAQFHVLLPDLECTVISEKHAAKRA